MLNIKILWILGVMILSMAMPVAWGAGQQIILETANLHLEYAVTEKDALELKEVSLRDRSWISRLEGPLFPIEPHRDGNGPRYVGPVELKVFELQDALGKDGVDLTILKKESQT